ncbi:MAG TPA: lamin tail domain-containing protein [Chitinophagaceae bacterium]|nr:lamin tail domain-containing protein [Chitinophagaceae bacterium]
MKRLFAWLFISIFIISIAHAKTPVSTTLVISQIYGDGGTTGSTYANDYIEIYNAGITSVNLANYSVQYSNGTVWNMTALTAVVLQPGQYYLIKEGSHGSGGTPLPNPDATGTLSILSNNGKVALVNSTSVLPNGCLSAAIVDLVGYGNANCSEGTATTAANNVTSITRKTGNVDTDNNSADFTIVAPNARTTSFVLPVSIGSFSVNKNGKANELRWQLNCTRASLTFELQRSTNGINFENIYKETATQFRCASPFTYSDNKPLEVNYYRLKIIDIDNNIAYSKIVLITNNISGRQALKINPTIVSSQAAVQYFSHSAENIQWVISDIKGKVIKKFAGSITPGENTFNMNTSNLTRGQYQLHGYTIQGKTCAVKFLKQ